MPLKILIIEDEELGAERLQKHLQAIDPTIDIVGVADSVRASVSWLSANTSPDVILMDIDLGDGQSFDIFNEVPVQSAVIFTTSYDEKALQAFKMNNIDYLLKPVRKLELMNLLNKYSNAHESHPSGNKTSIESLVKELQQQLHPKEHRQRFLVRQGKKLLSIEVHEVSFFYTDGIQNFLKTGDYRKFQLDYTIDELEHMLDPRHYFRINATHIVAASCILKVQEYFSGRLKLSLLCGEDKEAIIPRENVQAFKVWMAR